MPILLLLLALAGVSTACQWDYGGALTLTPGFSVRLERSGVALANVELHLHRAGVAAIVGLSGADGVARFSGVPAGAYFLIAQFNGLRFGQQGFFVGNGKDARSSETIRLDVQSVEVRRLVGHWVRRRSVETTVQRLGAKEPLALTSDSSGMFAFDSAREPGEYVLFGKGSEPRAFAGAMLVRLNPSAKRETLAVGVRWTSCGDDLIAYD